MNGVVPALRHCKDKSTISLYYTNKIALEREEEEREERSLNCDLNFPCQNKFKSAVV